MKLLISLISILIFNSCAPQGSFKSETIPQGGGYGTKYFVGMKITGNFNSSDNKCTNCLKELDDNSMTIQSDFIIENNSWVHNGNYVLHTIENGYKWYGNKSGQKDIMKHVIIKGEKIEINEDFSSDSYSVQSVFRKYVTIIQEREEEEERIQQAKLEKENIERKKGTCTSLGFIVGSDLHGQCVLEILKTERELALKDKELEILKRQADATQSLALAQAAQAQALQRQSDLNSSLQLLQLSQELLTPTQPTYSSPSINCITNPMGWRCY